MEENSVKLVTVRSVGVKYGLISALIFVVFFLVVVLLGQDAFDNKWGWIKLVVAVGILVWAQVNFKKEGDGFMSYGQGVGIGFWIALVSTLIVGIFTYIYANFIDTTVMDMFYQKQLQGMEEKNMPDAQIEMAVTWTKKLFWWIFFIVGILFGVIMAVLVSIFTQKKSPEPTI